MATIALAATGVLAFSVGYLLTPGVGDAEARAHTLAVSHGGVDATGVSVSRVARSVVAVEDHRFYGHGALDFTALARASGTWIEGSRGDPGGSTISQQLARLLYGQRPGALGPVGDALVAVKLEGRYSKSQILEMYLTAAYFGADAYGAAKAARVYFHKPLGCLDWAEATMLAGLLQAPSAFDPLTHFNRARARQRQVLRAVVRVHLLSSAHAQRAYRELRSLND